MFVILSGSEESPYLFFPNAGILRFAEFLLSFWRAKPKGSFRMTFPLVAATRPRGVTLAVQYFGTVGST